MIESIRDEKLIEQQLVYEENLFSTFLLDMEKNNEIEDIIAHQIDNFEENFYPDPESYFEDLFEYDFEDEFYYDNEDEFYYDYVDSMELAYSCSGFQTYIPNDDPFDNIDGCDYPEGPNENLQGVKYYDEFFHNIEYNYEDFEPIYEIDLEEAHIQSIESEYENQVMLEELNLNKLIEEHLEEEKRYLESIMEYINEMEQIFREIMHNT